MKILPARVHARRGSERPFAASDLNAFFSLKLANINNIPAHCNQILSQKAMECAIICQRSSLTSF